MPLGARTPEELETLLEDACLLGDEGAIAGLLEAAAVVVGRDGRARRGSSAALGLRTDADAPDRCYCADPGLVLQAVDLALVVSPDAINVVRRGSDRCWRLVICVLGR
ncbi:MAG TPA: hypothetical protein VNA14_07060 [Mycobacteriales bacterium]|nr:hypothetical protein [Mycobacteriales bacterium]